MEISKQVASLALCRRLKELGVRQESVYVWSYDNERYRVVTHSPHYDAFAAFTVAELGEILPERVYSFRGGVKCYCTPPDGLKDAPVMVDDTEANARAKMLVYLLENGLLEPDVIGSSWEAGEEAA